MICEKCQKNPATVHMTQIINGQKEEHHLCEPCAAESSFNKPISFQDFFNELLNISTADSQSIRETNTPSTNIYKCPVCSMTYESFIKSGKFGCAHCYEAFKPSLETIFRNIHGVDTHKGKIPKKSGGELMARREIETLRKQLNKAIEDEEFEKAASLRDRIKELEKGA